MTVASRSSATSWTSIDDLCAQSLGSLPSASQLAIMQPLAGERAEVREFVERFFRLMAIANVEARHLTPSVTGGLAVIIPGLLPGAWGGVIPPWTSEQRHHLIDQYVADNPWHRAGPGTVVLEMACGFPPTTAVDLARKFPDWRVIGADVQFDPYVLHNADGSYACLDAQGKVRFFHTEVFTYAAFIELYQDRIATKQRFENRFQSLAHRFPNADDGTRAVVEDDGASLIRNPLRGYELANLSFVHAGIGGTFDTVDVVRCLNVLFYFDEEFRSRAEEWALRTLREGGIFVCGGDMARTLEARYSVYQRAGNALVPREFAFSIDNVRPVSVMTFFSLHDRDRETWALARLVGVLRADEAFCQEYDAQVDRLMAEQRFFVRDEDGFLVPAPDPLPPEQWMHAREAMISELDRHGLVDRAVSVLRQAGFNAWRNPVGHVAIDPTALTDLYA